jgi:hypothetical protein
MKNQEAGKIVRFKSYLIIYKKIFHFGLREIKLNFIMIWQKMFYQVKKQLQSKVKFIYLSFFTLFYLVFFFKKKIINFFNYLFKGKLARLIKRYETIKNHNNQSGVERKDWYWFDKLDLIFGTRENITPSFIANKSTNDTIDNTEKEDEGKKGNYKKQKVKNNVEVMATAIAEMNQTREKIWDRKMSIEVEKIKLEKERIEVEKERWAYEREKEEREREKMKMDFELKMKELELKYQRKD